MKYLNTLMEINADFAYKEHSNALNNAPAYKMPMHIQPTAEILIVTDGMISFHIAGRQPELIRSGEAALIFPLQPHEYTREKGTEYFRFNFSPSLAKSFFVANEKNMGERSVFEVNREIVYPFLQKFKKESKPTLYTVKSFLYSVIDCFTEQVNLVEKSMNDDILTAVIFYINENKRSDITLKSLSATLGYNEKYISRLINRTAGFGYSTLLSILRVEDARFLLKNTNKTIIEIALECGFGSDRTFYRQFKQITGYSPIDYRKSGKFLTVRDTKVI